MTATLVYTPVYTQLHSTDADGHSLSITDVAYQQPNRGRGGEGRKDGRPRTVTYIPETVVCAVTQHQCPQCLAICHVGVPHTALPRHPITDKQSP